MLIKKICIALFFTLSIVGFLKAQDLHFSYFDLAPMEVNPANSGLFHGSARVGGIYRSQWQDVNGFKTWAIYFDSPVIKGFGKNQWVGVGVSVFEDKAGATGLNQQPELKQNKFGLDAAYHFGLDKNYSRIFSVGLHYGNRSYSFDPSNFVFRGINDFGGTQEGNTNFSDISLGLIYSAKIDKNNSFKMGVTGAHLNSPDLAILPGNNNTQGNPGIARDSAAFNSPVRTTAFGEYTTYLNNKLRLKPAVLFQTRSGDFELEGNVLAGYLINRSNRTVLNFGLGYRVSGSAQFLFGFEQKDFKIGASFDLYNSGFSGARGTQTAFELGASYIIKVYKKPQVQPSLLCPRF